MPPAATQVPVKSCACSVSSGLVRGFCRLQWLLGMVWKKQLSAALSLESYRVSMLEFPCCCAQKHNRARTVTDLCADITHKKDQKYFLDAVGVPAGVVLVLGCYVRLYLSSLHNSLNSYTGILWSSKKKAHLPLLLGGSKPTLVTKITFQPTTWEQIRMNRERTLERGSGLI